MQQPPGQVGCCLNDTSRIPRGQIGAGVLGCPFNSGDEPNRPPAHSKLDGCLKCNCRAHRPAPHVERSVWLKPIKHLRVVVTDARERPAEVLVCHLLRGRLRAEEAYSGHQYAKAAVFQSRRARYRMDAVECPTGIVGRMGRIVEWEKDG